MDRDENISLTLEIAIYLSLLLVLSIVVKPLYKLAKSIEGIFFIFIDCTLQIFNTSLTVINLSFLWLQYCETKEECEAVPVAIKTASQIPLELNAIFHDSIFGLLVIIAINRFNAIFFPFNYNRIWKLKNKKIFLLLDLLLAICSRITHLILGYPKWLYNYLVRPYYILCLALPLVIYLMILVKLLCRCNHQMGVTPNELRQDRVRIAFICFLTIVPWELQQLSVDWLEDIVNLFVRTPCPARTLSTLIGPVTFCMQVAAQLSHVVGILVLNRQFRQLLRAHFIGGVQLLRRLFRRQHSGAVHPSPPVAAVVVRPAREAWQMQ